ncbi:unnamed protein product, partial [marine sediment metagenome]
PSEKEIKKVKPQKRTPDKKKVSKPKPDHLDLQEIPKLEKLNEIEDDTLETQTPSEDEVDEELVESEQEDEEEDADILKEITPQP